MTQKMQSRIVDLLERKINEWNLSLDEAEYQHRGNLARALSTDEGEIRIAAQRLRKNGRRIA